MTTYLFMATQKEEVTKFSDTPTWYPSEHSIFNGNKEEWSFTLSGHPGIKDDWMDHLNMQYTGSLHIQTSIPCTV